MADVAISNLQHGCLQDRWRLAKQLGPLAAVPAGFAVFVAANGNVVIGDRLMHAPVWHLAQLLYFLLFAAAALAPATISPDRSAHEEQAAQIALYQRLAVSACCVLLVSIADAVLQCQK